MHDLDIYPFFLNLDQEEKERFISFLKPISLPQNTIIHYQGDVCKDVLLLTTGKVRLYTQADDFSDEVTLYTLSPGEQCLANTASVLGHSKTIGTAVTQEPVQGYVLNEKHIERLMQTFPLYQHYVFSLYGKKLAELSLAISRIKFQNLDKRIMEYLGENKKETISITHEKLAQEMNTSRSVVSRVLKKLEYSRKIKLHRGYIEIF